jgi:hypothetical protein
MKTPTDEGRRRWPTADGYLKLRTTIANEPEKLACTCTDTCKEPDCQGSCGCEACALARLVYEDDRALWDEQGNLVAPEELDEPSSQVADLNQLRVRFSDGAWLPAGAPIAPQALMTSARP